MIRFLVMQPAHLTNSVVAVRWVWAEGTRFKLLIAGFVSHSHSPFADKAHTAYHSRAISKSQAVGPVRASNGKILPREQERRNRLGTYT